jgi:hypothetical protein
VGERRLAGASRPLPIRPGEGLLSDHTAGIQPANQELVFMPQSGLFADRKRGLSKHARVFPLNRWGATRK